ncbi:hypothetical protein CHELA20_10743 [Hyphomicrobiales bacterium]|nr:hypothetical protein CHELA20_10743 [Hyphomicrobiales bacterium]CAH1693545.1 hypothetical protein CHELA41_50974 [Hyphomicrobiales bacterium]
MSDTISAMALVHHSRSRRTGGPVQAKSIYHMLI